MHLCLLSKLLTKFNPNLHAFKHDLNFTMVFEIIHFKVLEISLTVLPFNLSFLKYCNVEVIFYNWFESTGMQGSIMN